jgi:hypothetical protein
MDGINAEKRSTEAPGALSQCADVWVLISDGPGIEMSIN